LKAAGVGPFSTSGAGIGTPAIQLQLAISQKPLRQPCSPDIIDAIVPKIASYAQSRKTDRRKFTL
jgi:hypothetical protein